MDPKTHMQQAREMRCPACDTQFVDGLLHDTRAELERLRAALAELVALKRLKDRKPEEHETGLEILKEYQRRKPAAWAAAFALVDAGPCKCGDRAASACPGEWEQGCDLGNNERFVRVRREGP